VTEHVLKLPAFVISIRFVQKNSSTKTLNIMKSRVVILVAILSFIFSLSTFAQTPTDALRLSYLQQGNNTARSMGVGGALGALGADYAAIGVNPAGLASFRTSEFMLTAGYANIKTDSKLRDKTIVNNVISDTKTKFYLNNIGFVGSIRPKKGNWTTQNWSIGLNRNANFDASFYFKGASQGSIINRFQEKANSNRPDFNQFEEDLAIEAGALYFYPQNDESRYDSDFDGHDSKAIDKSQQGITEGRLNEFTFAYAANYKEKVQIGASINVPYMSYYDNRLYEEDDIETLTDLGKIPSFKHLEFRENYAATGRGVNAKFGIILKPIQQFRIGASLQTPTRFKLSESYNNIFSYTYWDQNLKEYTNKAESPDGAFDYVIRTPWRFTGSAAILAGKKGFLSADVEYINYAQMAFEYGVDYKGAEVDDNSEIKVNYTSTVNVRLGAEATMDIFRFRAGIATLGLPTRVENSQYLKNAAKTYTLGLGLRENRFYLDLAYQFIRTSDVYSPYRVSTDYEQPTIDRTKNSSQFIATMGFKF
jgi:hypothetical protein